MAFRPDSHSIVVLRGDVGHKNFWLVDLRTGAEQQVTGLAPEVDIRDFELSRDGDAIQFDRVTESSRIALIERGGQPAVRLPLAGAVVLSRIPSRRTTTRYFAAEMRVA